MRWTDQERFELLIDFIGVVAIFACLFGALFIERVLT